MLIVATYQSEITYQLRCHSKSNRTVDADLVANLSQVDLSVAKTKLKILPNLPEYEENYVRDACSIENPMQFQESKGICLSGTSVESRHRLTRNFA